MGGRDARGRVGVAWVRNFRLLAEHGYYDALTFHRIVAGFMIQAASSARRRAVAPTAR